MGPQTTMSEKQDRIAFEYAGKPVELPLMRGTEGEVAVDISKLRSATGLITLDPGLGNSAVVARFSHRPDDPVIHVAVGDEHERGDVHRNPLT